MDPDSHKNEGWIKSIWHTLTNHPAHQKDSETGADKKDSSAGKDSDKKDSDSKKDNDNKKE